MKNTWRQLLRRLAVGCIISGTTVWFQATCYAAQLAYDTPDDPAYADGWQAGDNGGAGFTPWNFDSRILWQGTWYTYANPGVKSIDDGMKAGASGSNPFNDIGRAWAMAQTPDSDGVNRVGRGFPALQPGQTFSIVVDNPMRRQHFKGYFIRLNGGTGGMDSNICYGSTACAPGVPTPKSKLNVRMFEYFTYGRWQIADSSFGDTTLFDTDTAAGGMRLDVTLTGPDSYDLVMTPLANPEAAYMQSGIFANPGVPIDWFELTFFNTNTDTGTPPSTATDFYIRSMEITDAASPGVPGDLNGDGNVDAADYVWWRKTGGSQQQYDTWRMNFGSSGAGSGQTVVAAGVPEPAAVVCLIVLIAGSSMLRW